MYSFYVNPYVLVFVFLDDDFYEEDDEDDPDALKDPIYQIDLQVTCTLCLCTAKGCLNLYKWLFSPLFPRPILQISCLSLPSNHVTACFLAISMTLREGFCSPLAFKLHLYSST